MRRGLQSQAAGFIGDVNYIDTYRMPNGSVRTLYLDQSGNFYYEDVTNNPGFKVLIGAIESSGADIYGCGFTHSNGTKYIAFSDGLQGLDIPMQYNGTNFDRVSQDGPGIPPVVVDFLPPSAVIGLPGGGTISNITGATWGCSGVIVEDGPTKPILIPVWNCFTITTAAPHGFAPGQLVTIAGVTNPQFNGGPVAIFSVPSPTTFKIGDSTAPLQVPKASAGANSSGGTASVGPPPGITIQRFNNTSTANTTSAHGFQVGWNVAIAGIADVALANIASAVRQNGVSTIVTATPHKLVVGSRVDITGITGDASFNTPTGTQPFVVLTVPDATHFTYAQNLADSITATASTGSVATVFNGTFLILSLPTPLSFTYADVGPNSNAVTTGTAAIQGSISAGQHQVRQAFLLRDETITRFSPLATFIAGGGKLLAVSNLIIGPSNVVARILAFTGTGGASFFYIAVPTVGSGTSTQVNDNTSTSIVVDFADTTLFAATSIDTPGNNLVNNATLQPCLGVFGYKDRTVWWGERNSLQNLLNMSFDGGFAGATPTGWTTDPTNGAGGASSTNAVWGFSYQITGDGATALLGMITQSAFQDYNNIPILLPNTSYSVRLSLAATGAPVSGNAVVELFSPSLGSLGTFAVPAASIGTSFAWQSGVIATMPSVVPSDLLLRYYVSGTLTSAATILADEMTLFPTSQPVNVTQARVSYVINPATFDGVTGIIILDEARGENLFSTFQLRSDLYFNTDGGKYRTSDDNVSEPSNWPVEHVANSSGTTSVHGSISGENWEVTIGEKGAYMFAGGEPLKITQEISTSVSGITPAWDQINWQAGFTIWGVNDIKRRILYFGVPMGNATKPNLVWMIDYKELQTSTAIADSGPIHTSYSGKVISWEPGRKTSPWNMQINCAAMVRRQDDTDHLWMGSGAGTGKVYEPVDGQYSDDGAPINSFYVTYMLPSQTLAQQDPRMGLGRMLFSFLKLFVSGNGTLNITALPLTITNTGPSYTLPLSTASNEDMESPIRVAGERCAFQVGTNAVGSWWSMGKFTLRLRRHPMSVFRHRN